MPSGKKDIYGTKSKALYKAGDMAGEIGAARNAAAAAKYVKPKPDMREGTTNPSGGRPAVKMPAKAAPAKMPAKMAAPKQAVIRTTTAYKPTPMGKKR
jgi:hypothetical protein